MPNIWSVLLRCMTKETTYLDSFDNWDAGQLDEAELVWIIIVITPDLTCTVVHFTAVELLFHLSGTVMSYCEAYLGWHEAKNRKSVWELKVAADNQKGDFAVTINFIFGQIEELRLLCTTSTPLCGYGSRITVRHGSEQINQRLLPGCQTSIFHPYPHAYNC